MTSDSKKCVEILCKHASKISLNDLTLSIKLALYLSESFEIIQVLLTTMFRKLSIVSWAGLESSKEMQFLLQFSQTMYNDVSLFQGVENLVSARSGKSKRGNRSVECLRLIDQISAHCKQKSFENLCKLIERDIDKYAVAKQSSVSDVVRTQITSENVVTISGKWKLLEKLGKGGFGWVHKASVIDSGNDENNNDSSALVALKFISKPKSNSQKNKLLREQVINEIKVYNSIKNHDNVVKLYSYDLEAQYPKPKRSQKQSEQAKTKNKVDDKQEEKQEETKQEFIDCMILELEYCEYGSIVDSSLISIIHNYSKDESTKTAIIRTYFKQLINAITACHDKGIIHRDLKLSNLLIDSNYQLKVADFGICKLVDIIDDSNVSKINDRRHKVGTRGFMAPEIMIGRNYNESCDIFSAGVVLFYLLFGQKPFNNASFDDKTFIFVIQQNFNTFWKLHSKTSSVDYNYAFHKENETREDLIWQMFEFNPAYRIKIFHIQRHDWYKKESMDAEQLCNRMKQLFLAKYNTKEDQKNFKLATTLQSNVLTQIPVTTNEITMHPSEWHEQEIKSLSDSLVIMIGCGDYDDDVMADLESVSVDYKRVIYVFHKKFWYSVIYKTGDGKTVYLTLKNASNYNQFEIGKQNINNKYKLYWTWDDIDKFVDEARDEYFDSNQHDGLIIIASSHGESEVMLTSDGDEFPLLAFIHKFGEARNNKKNKKGPPSNKFTNLPKICVFDMCRRNKKPHIPKAGVEYDNEDSNDETNKIQGVFKGKRYLD